MIIRDLGPGDLNAAWAINQANTPEVGDVGLDRFSWIADLASFNLVAEDGQAWDAVLLVRYPARAAFARMVADPEYQQVTHLRTEALSEAVLQPTSAWG